MEVKGILKKLNNVYNSLGSKESCGCGCSKKECSKRAGDCDNIIPFSNLLNLPANFCPCSSSDWSNLKISVMPYLYCILEPCTVKDAHLIFTDPCGIDHDIEKFIAHVKRARVVGSIEYIISAQSTVSDVSVPPASVSDFYTIHVDKVVEFIDDCNIDQCSVIVGYQDLGFDDPPEYVYGNNHALQIIGSFVINLGYITNGSFEHNFMGWTQVIPPGAAADTVTCFDTYAPVEGCYFSLIKTDGPGNSNLMSQEFKVKAGDTISGWSFFKTNDYMPFDDRCQVVIKAGTTVVETLFSASVSTVGDYGSTPWTYWEYTFTADGTYTIEATITNSLDSIFDSYMGLDAIQLIPA